MLKLLLKSRPAAIDSQQPALQQGYLACFSRGLLGNLLNPKVGIFYVSFLPQFIPAGASVALWCSLMALAHMLLGLIWNAVLIGGSHYFAGHLRTPRVLKVMDRLTGCVFIRFAAKLALSRR